MAFLTSGGISFSLSSIWLNPLPNPSSMKCGLINSESQVLSSKERLSKVSKKLLIPFSGSPSISLKPIFLGEFGVDAFDKNLGPEGAVNEPVQADWDRSQWDDIFRHLSANDPSQVALGGTVHECVWRDKADV